MDRLVLFGLLMVLAAAVIEAADWNYEPDSPYGPHNWNVKFPDECDPMKYPRQSPIDIKRGFLRYNAGLGELRHDNFDTQNVLFQATNNGHTVQFNLLGDVETEGGPVGDTHYYALQLHFHWGKDSIGYGHGSEHTVLGAQHKAEMHIVHVNHKHSKLDVSEVVKKDDGLLVLGVFIDVEDPSQGKYANKEFDKIMVGVNKTKDKALSTYNMTKKEQLNLSKLLPMEQKYYYTYPGGLTTPNCHGAVTWIVYRNPIYITREQLELFFTVKDKYGKNLTNTFRPPQEVNGRLVQSTHPEDSIGSAAGQLHMSIAATLACILISLFL